MKAKIALCAVLLATATWSEAATIKIGTVSSYKTGGVGFSNKLGGSEKRSLTSWELADLRIMWIPPSMSDVIFFPGKKLIESTPLTLNKEINVPSYAQQFIVVRSIDGRTISNAKSSVRLDVKDGHTYDIVLV